MIIHPFKAWRATAQSVQRLASVPYDVVDTEEARTLADGNAISFLHVVRSEIDLQAGTNPYSVAVYDKAAENFDELRNAGHLSAEAQPSLYAYRMTMADHVQLGLMACCSVDEYNNGIIRKHELTRQDKERDRTRHILRLRAQTGPVLIAYRDDSRVASQLEAATRGVPTLECTSETGVRHELWSIRDTTPMVEAFAPIPHAYIADGHHRSASAASACAELCGSSVADAGRECRFFLAALFPASQMKILAYNRIVADLGGLSPEELLDQATQRFDVVQAVSPIPEGPGQFCLYLAGQWQQLNIKPQYANAGDPVRSLDCSLLQEHIIDPLLGIKDVRQDPRISFVGGIRGTETLEQRADKTGGVAFSLHPTTMQQLMAVADAGHIMPPKSTWFEPKLRSGMVVHVLT